MKDKAKIVCPKCKREGFLSKRWVRSYYYPKKRSWLCDALMDAEAVLNANPNLEDKEITVTLPLGFTADMVPESITIGDYIKRKRERISGNKYSADKKDRDAFRVRSRRKYLHYYVGHYDSVKYNEQMERPRSGKRKSRPNGRKWCKLPNGIDLDSLTRIN